MLKLSRSLEIKGEDKIFSTKLMEKIFVRTLEFYEKVINENNCNPYLIE